MSIITAIPVLCKDSVFNWASRSSAQALSAVFSASRDEVLTQLSSARRSRASAPSSDAVLGLQSEALAATDAGSLLGKSNAVLGLAVERRTPIVTDTLARGRRVGQQAASGSFWFPARQDLDTMLSKIDSRIISDIIVIKGPYSALHGPGRLHPSTWPQEQSFRPPPLRSQ